MRLSNAVPAAFALPAAVALALATRIAWHDRGSIAAADFLGPAILVALIAATVLLAGAAVRPARDVALAAGLLLALAIWAGISAWWAPVPSLARDEALIELFGLLALALPVLTLRSARDRRAGIWVLGGGLALLALATAVHLLGSSDPADVFRYRRLSFPITYANAVAAFFLAGFWPATALAARRGSSPLARGLACGAATALLAASLLAQSKGALVGLGASLVVVACVSPARLRLLLAALLAAVPVAAAFERLVAPYRAAGDAMEVARVHQAAAAVLVAAAAGALLGLCWALVDVRVALGPARRRLVGRAALCLLVAAIAGGAAAFAASTRRPEAWLAHQWRAFKHPEHGGSTHLVELGSNRYDFWRVAIGELRRHPVAGGGARSFGPVYLVHGRSPETPARAHSLPLEVLAEEGAVGFALGAAGYGLLLLALARRARRRSTAATAALAGCVLLLAQACADWTFTFPAVTVPFFLLAGVGLAGGRLGAEPSPLTARAGLAGGAACALLAAVVFAPPWLSARLIRFGLDDRDPAALRWAHRLDPVSVEPWLAEARLAPTAGAALVPLERARVRAPRSLAVRYLLGTAYLRAGEPAAARRELETALALHPGDPAVLRALGTVRGPKP